MLLFNRKKVNGSCAIWLVLLLLMLVPVALSGCKCAEEDEWNELIKFSAKMNDLAENFQYKDYTELIGAERTHVSAVPLEAHRIDSSVDRFLNRQKAFVYRNSDECATIILEVTLSKSDVNEWSHSFPYSPSVFNADNAMYSSEHDDRIPDIQINSQAFLYEGCNYSVICFTDDDGMKSSEIIMDFCNQLIEYLTKG